MLRLIQPDLASSGQPHFRNGTPSFFVNFRALHALLRQCSDLRFQVIAHEVEFMDRILLRWVECGFWGRQGKDQPTMPRIHGFEPEDVTKKCAVGLDVFAVDNHVSAKNHLPSSCPATPNNWHLQWKFAKTQPGINPRLFAV